MDATPNPFAVLSLIVAPAILTNASSVLVMSTSNRLARATDRARELAKQLEEETAPNTPEEERRLAELTGNERRALLLVRGLRSFYVALGAFSAATLTSLLGAVLVSIGVQHVVRAFELIGVATGLIAVGAILNGSTLLLRETRIAVQILSQRAAKVRERAGK